MRLTAFFQGAFCAAATVLLSARGEEEASSGSDAVVVLTKENFDQHIEQNSLTLVKFYAPWCGHCKRLAPEYEKAAEELKEDNVPLAKVDATEENALATKYNIRGFPTLFLFRDGEAEEYTGGRTAEGIVQWVRRMSTPAVVSAESLEKAKELVAGEPFGVIAVVKGEETDAVAVFKTVAESNRVAGRFVQVVDASAETEHVRIYRASEEYESEALEFSTADEMSEKVRADKLPFFGAVSGENFRDYVTSGLDLVWFAGTEEDYNNAASDVRAAAKSVRGKALFLWLDTDKFGDHAVRALAVKDYPALVYQKSEDSSRYVFEEATEDKFPTDAVVTFVEDVLAGKVEKSLMSEPVPETNDEPVKVVVGKTFEEIVMDPKKDVLLEVYAPWCGHCKKFEPAYNEFAEKISKNSHIVVAKMDGTANESPVADFEWKGFPTVFWAPAGADKKPVQYDGPRTVEGLMEWVTSRSSETVVVDEDASEESAAKDEL